MTHIARDSIRGVAGPVHDALVDTADELEDRPRAAAHNRNLTLAIVAGACFVLGFLWAKARAQMF